MDLKELVGSLRSTIETARSMPMSASAVINRAEVLELVNRLEAALPMAFADSDKVVSERDSVVGEARTEAAEIVKKAEDERDRLASDTEVYRIARREADKVRADAQQEAEELRSDTDDYVDGRLANLEITLSKTLEAVARGRQRLHGRSGLEQADAPATDDTDAFPFPNRD